MLQKTIGDIQSEATDTFKANAIVAFARNKKIENFQIKLELTDQRGDRTVRMVTQETMGNNPASAETQICFSKELSKFLKRDLNVFKKPDGEWPSLTLRVGLYLYQRKWRKVTSRPISILEQRIPALEEIPCPSCQGGGRIMNPAKPLGDANEACPECAGTGKTLQTIGLSRAGIKV